MVEIFKKKTAKIISKRNELSLVFSDDVNPLEGDPL